jgi:DNA-binding GntR family transcriptional regulator
MLEPFARTYMTAMAPGADLRWLADRHVAIIDALEARDAERAAAAMRTHAREAEQQILSATGVA